MSNLSDALPSDAASIIEGQLQSVLSSQSTGLLSFGIIGAIWSASAAMNTIIKALNRAYDAQESRPFWRKTGLAVGLTVLAGAFLVGAFAVLLTGQLFATQIGDVLGIEGALVTVLNILRFPLVALFLIVATAFLYWAAPNVEIPFRWVSPGAVLFIVAWIVFTLGFGFYVANFGNYNATYGTLGGVIVLMVWLYLSSFIMLVGAEVNAVLHARMQPESMKAPTAEPRRGAVATMRQERGR